MAIERKQKILIVLIIVALLYVLWQVYDLFGANWFKSNTSQPLAPPAIAQIAPIDTSREKLVTAAPSTNTTTMSVDKPNTTLVDAKPTAAVDTAAVDTAPVSITPTSSTAAARVAASNTVPITTIDNPSNFYVNQNQAAYLQLVNQYQLLKMQRMVVDEQAAIAQAKQQIAKEGIDVSLPTVATDSSGSNSSDYKLMYIDHQNNQWAATLSKMGQYFEVTPGMQLLDGTQVLAITQQGVTLKEGSQKLFLNFFGSAPMSDTKSAPSNPPLLPEHEQQALQNMKPKFSAPVAAMPSTETAIEQLPSNIPAIPEKVTPSIAKAPAKTLVPAKPAIPQVKPSAGVPIIKGNAKPVNANAPAKTVITDTISKQTTIETAETTLKPVEETPAVAKSVPLTAQQTETYNKVQNIVTSQKPAQAISYTSDEQKILNTPRSHYTLQFSSGRDEQGLKDFAQQYKLQNTFIVRTLYLRKTWYILITGDYDNYVEAQKALADLSKSEKALRPWIRPLANIQDAIKLFSQKAK
jgi:septal ring-binding cell division protein DamX